MLRTFAALLFVTGLTACSQSMCSKPAEPIQAPVSSETSTPTLTRCPEQRPEVCTFDYRPVCATLDTGVRCVTTPCPSTEQKTYSNACSACADKKVIGYIPDECTTTGTTHQQK